MVPKQFAVEGLGGDGDGYCDRHKNAHAFNGHDEGSRILVCVGWWRHPTLRFEGGNGGWLRLPSADWVALQVLCACVCVSLRYPKHLKCFSLPLGLCGKALGELWRGFVEVDSSWRWSFLLVG